jgi:BTB/POZ domain
MAGPGKSMSASNDADPIHGAAPNLMSAKQPKPLPERELSEWKLLQNADSSRLLTDEIVALYVGPKRKAYYVHKALLCNRSSYFRAVFRDNVQFREGAEMRSISPMIAQELLHS